MARLARVIAVGVPRHITQRATRGALSCKTKRIEKSISIYYGKARKCSGSTDRLLPDAEPCPPCRRPTEGRCTGTRAEAGCGKTRDRVGKTYVRG